MSSWFDHWDRRYTDRVRLLVEILPVLAQEPRFALKGGTAINLFEHDLPRLSVDIDLAWLPANDYATDVKSIAGADLQGRGRGADPPGGQSWPHSRADRDNARDAWHSTPGTYHDGQAEGGGSLRLRRSAGAGFCRPVYAGKLSAALSRQHPRDLFDVGLLLRDERADQSLWRTFLVYLTCSPKPVWDMLAPPVPADFAATFETHFKGPGGWTRLREHFCCPWRQNVRTLA